MNFSKKIFVFLLVLASGVALYMGACFFTRLHNYFELTHKVKVTFEGWGVEEKRPGKFFLVANGHFTWKGAIYYETYEMRHLVYPNPYLAEEMKEKWRQSTHDVWINPKNPHRSALIRSFPFKAGAHLLLSLGVLFYFVWLRIYVKRVEAPL